jgi:hypothetical protein
MKAEAKEVYDAIVSLDQDTIAMINEANVVLTEIGKKWKQEGKLGPKSVAAILIVVLKKYADIKLPPESLPMLVSVAWAVARTLSWKEVD